MTDLIDYPCPECGYEGPHRSWKETAGTMAECGDSACAAEFEVLPP